MKRLNLNTLICVALVALLAMAVACGGSTSGKPTAPQGADASGTDFTSQPISAPGIASPLGFPALPMEEGDGYSVPPTRVGDALTSITLEGGDCYSRKSPGTGITADNGLQFSLYSDEYRWAIYRFEGLGPGAQLKLLTLNWEVEQGDTAYLALPDYDAGYWRFTKVTAPTGLDVFEVTGAELLSPGRNFYVALIVPPANDPTIRSLRLDIDMLLPPPLGVSATYRSIDNAVRIQWELPEETYAADQGFSYDKLLVQRADSEGGPWVTLSQLPPGTSSFLDTGAFGGLEPQEDYFYRVLCTKGAEQGYPSDVAQGSAGSLPLPRILAAPDHGSRLTLVKLDAGFSTTQNSISPMIYQWDLDNDSVFEESGLVIEAVLDLSMSKVVRLKATDEFGLSAFVSKTLTHRNDNWFRVIDDPTQFDPDMLVQFVGGDGPTYTWSVTLGYELVNGQAPFTSELDPRYDGVLGPAVIGLGATGTGGANTKVVAVTVEPGDYYFALRATDTTVPVPQGISTDTYVWPTKVRLQVPPWT
jgi:hypothetical protein